MFTLSRPLDSIKSAPILILIALLPGVSIPETGLASKEARDPAKPILLALDDCDRDNDHRTAPFGDNILLLNSNGELVRKIHRLTVGHNFAGCRAISVSEDGRFFTVCEDSVNKISAYETSSGRKLWSLSGLFRSAVFAQELIYALAAESVYAIDNTGTIVKHSRIGGGIDIAYDPSGRCLWIVGMDVKKCSLDLKIMMKSDPVRGSGGAFSVDVNPDGSIWVAAQHMPRSSGSANGLLKISPEGMLLASTDLDFPPRLVRADPSDGGVWTTGTTVHEDFSRIGDEWPETLAELKALTKIGMQVYTQKYDSRGVLLVELSDGGTSIELDPSDGSIWIAGERSILHYSSEGANLSTYTGVSADKKWLAIVP